MESKKPVYESKGGTKKIIFMYKLICSLLVLSSIVLFIRKETKFVMETNGLTNKIGTKSRYVLASGNRLILAIFFVVFAVVFINMIFVIKRSEIKLYDKYMEFTSISIVEALGLKSSKNLKMIRVSYSDIVRVREDDLRSLVCVDVNGKQYNIICKDVKKVGAIIKGKVSSVAN